MNEIRTTSKESGSPPISIIIPVFNQLDLTRRCLSVLADRTPAHLYELIVIDNGSTDQTAKVLTAKSRRGELQLVTNAHNLGFAQACNQGAERANGRYLLFLNNDTEVQQHWLEPLLATLDDDPAIGAVASKLIFPDGTLQHAGIVLEHDDAQPMTSLVARHLHLGQPADLPAANRAHTFQALSGTSLAVRRDAFFQAGEFCTEYWNGYDDVDLCLRLRSNGWQLVYQPASVVVHHDAQSGRERFRRSIKNLHIFNRKWSRKTLPDIINDVGGSRIWNQACCGDFYRGPAGNEGPIASVIVILKDLHLTQPEYLRKLFANTATRHEIILVLSHDGDLPGWLHETLESRTNCLLIHNNMPQNQAHGINLGMLQSMQGGSDYLCLIQDDVFVTPGWLDRLLDTAERNPRVGMVGPMTNAIAGPQRLASVEYDTDTMANLDRFAAERSTRFFRQPLRNWRAASFCLLIRRELVERIGGLDTRFSAMLFVEDDFCLRARLAGFRTYHARDCYAHSTNDHHRIGKSRQYKEELRRNWNVFLEKWQLPATIRQGRNFDLTALFERDFSRAVHFTPLPGQASETLLPSPMKLAGQLQAAEVLIQAGSLLSAEQLYRSVLDWDPVRYHALNLRARKNLSVVLWRLGIRREAKLQAARAEEQSLSSTDRHTPRSRAVGSESQPNIQDIKNNEDLLRILV